VQTRKLDALAIDILELQLTLPWRPSPKSGARVNVLTSGVRATLRYDTAGSAGSRYISARCSWLYIVCNPLNVLTLLPLSCCSLASLRS
jgi:hypothetical protein